MKFDDYIDRNQYPTMKWSHDFLADHFGNKEAIPMSVADMDFMAPPAVIKKLRERVEHGIYGYESKPSSYYTALQSWYLKRHKWQIARQHIEDCPSILNAISILISKQSDEGDGVIIQAPVFFEFKMVIKSNGRKIIKNPLKLVDGRYQMDFEDLEAKAADLNNKILIICNPHNPVGRVWTTAELEQVADICVRYDVFVISDEIHGDFTFGSHKYTPLLTLPERVIQNTAVCISPAKTFNISGMVDALTIIPNDTHRERFHDFAHRHQINKVNVFATAAIQAAYEEGADWLDELLIYIQGNIDLIRKFLEDHDLNITMVEPEGTFLLWLDFRRLELDAKVLAQFLAEEANLAICPGYWFGREGAGFGRMTIGCPRSTIQRALDNLATAVKNR